MKLYLPITVDLYNIYPLKVLNLQQNNIGRGAQITLTAAGTVIVPDSEALYVYAKKPDGTVVYNTCELKDNQIQVDFDEQMTVTPGVLQVELQMVDSSGNSITTPIFQVNVQTSNIDYQKITSQDSFQALVTTLAEAQELKKTGLKGDPGEAATIQIGTVTASDPGSDPEVTNSGTQQDAVLNFVLPRGIQGPTGPKGDPGTANAATVAYDNSTSGAEETNAQDAFDKLYGDITILTNNLGKHYYKRAANVKLTAASTFQKYASFENLQPGIYIVIANAQQLKGVADTTDLSWLSVVGDPANPLAGDGSAVTFPGGTKYPIANYGTIINLSGNSINAYIQSTNVNYGFNLSLSAVRIK